MYRTNKRVHKMTLNECRNVISKSRNEIMGISILWIMLHHVFFFNLWNFELFTFPIMIGSWGVDIFLFLSSFGLYHSFSSNNHLLRFYKRRINRILPVFLLIYLSYH